ncbi:MAG: M15 family metallopeptidase [Ilumatobacteraceae bacterium]
MRTRTMSALIALATLAVAVPVAALGPGDVIDDPASATQQAANVTPLATDVVTVYNSGVLSSSVAAGVTTAARQAGAAIAFGGSASVGMVGIYRGNTVTQAPAAGYSYPMGTTVLPPAAVGATMGRDVAAHLATDAVVMGQTSATLPGRSVQAGDSVALVAAWGSVIRFRVAAVLPDSAIGGTEILMSSAAAARLGITEIRRAVIWNPTSRTAMNTALAANGLVSTSVRIRRSWDPPDPDDTLGMAQTKKLLGEFQYRVNANGSVSQQSSWQAANLPSGRVNVGLGIRARCHNVVAPAITAALTEAANRGVSWTINVGDANLAGGCHYPRFNRLTPNSSLGFLSRHSWGMALDTNTRGSCQGCIPDFSKTWQGCTVVEIFRKHGFAWGGNFLTPDGMHFEYVGEPRNQLAYPSRFCANSGAALQLTTDEAGIDTFFASDGLYLGEH